MTMEIGTNAKGGYLQQPYLSRDTYEQMLGMMTAMQIVTAVNGYGKKRGETVDFTIYGTLNEDAVDLNETDLLRVTDLDIIRSSTTVVETGIAVAWTDRLEMLAELPVEAPIRREISKNMTKILDGKVVTAAKAGQLVYTPTGTVGNESYTLSTTGAATANATARGIQTWDLDAVAELALQTYYIPFWDGQRFIALGSESSMTNLMQDDSFKGMAELMKYTPKNANQFMNNEIQSFGRFRFLIDTQNMNQYIQNESGTDNAAGAKGDFVFCGQDCVHEARVLPVDIRSDEWNFNRFSGIAAIYLGSFKNVFSAQTAAGLVRTIRTGSLA